MQVSGIESMDLNVKVIRPVGILDGTSSAQLRSEISQFIEEGVRLVLVDLEEVSFMDSSGLGSLVLAFKSVQSAGGKLCVCSINDQIKMVLELTSMDLVFDIFANREAFDSAMIPQS